MKRKIIVYRKGTDKVVDIVVRHIYGTFTFGERVYCYYKGKKHNIWWTGTGNKVNYYGIDI